MKRRVEQLINGIFEYEPQKLQLSTDKIELQTTPGEKQRGSFEISSLGRKKVKGFIFSSDVRMAYGPTDFASQQEKIVYEFDSAGMQEEEVLEGTFTICTNVGEYNIPFRAAVRPRTHQHTGEMAASLDEFVELAKTDYQQAYAMFRSEGFKRMLTHKKILALYQGLTSLNFSYRCLEEFLVGCGQKEPVQIQLDGDGRSFSKLTQVVMESITLTKSTWGFLQLDMKTDAEFLSLSKRVVTTDEFIGSRYRLDYLIDVDKLHAGQNYGRIKICGPYQIWQYEVKVYQEGKKGHAKKLLMQQKEISSILKSYIEFKLQKIDVHTWIERSKEAQQRYQLAGGRDTLMSLYKAQLLFADAKEHEACMLLSELDQHKERLNKPEILGYYLYLTTFYNKDPKYMEYVEESIERLLIQNRKNWQLQWFQLYLNHDYRIHPSRKLDAIRWQYEYGCCSRVMYLEAYFILVKHPMLLKKLDDFGLRVLQFMVREEQMTAEISMQVSDLTGRYESYTEELYQILNFCYQKYPTKSLVKSVCSLLIKAHKTSSRYLIWYERGIEHELRMTGLYEYYVEALPESHQSPLPTIVRMYFLYHNSTLDYKKKATVYANVISNRRQDEKTFQSYRPVMEKFIVDQLSAGRIDTKLALIYQTFLTRSILNKKMADHLAKILFTYEIHCDVPYVKQVLVRHAQLKQEQCVAMINGKANIQLYAKDYQILFMDAEDNRFVHTISYQLHHVLDMPGLLSDCRELSPNNPALTLYTCSRLEEADSIHADHINSFCNILEMEEVEETYKKRIRIQLLDYYSRNPKDPALYEFLHRIDRFVFIKADKEKLIELLAAEGMCKEAFELLSIYGAEHVGDVALVRICSRMILDCDYQADEMLVGLCYRCLCNGKYDEIQLAYLLKHYDGPIENMKFLWKTAREFKLDTFQLEEKIMIMLIFMRCGANQTENIFESYRRKMGKQKLIQAYVIYRCYDYAVKEYPVGQPVFDYLERWYHKGFTLEPVCALALLRHYAEKPSLPEEQEIIVHHLLEEYAHKNMRFSFFKKFDKALGRAFSIYDKSFVEYRTNPDAAVTLHYRIELDDGTVTAEHSEPMRNVYEGIFVKELILLQGEMFIYHITEELDGKIKEQAEEVLICEEESKHENTKYDILNRLSGVLETKDIITARREILLYQEQKYLAEKIFTLQ